ncbi:ribonuclease G [Desulfotomaculum arcticum]|uniref:Ribonuclease G n=1 Tax=Desulfotruncus arcticus DSM 17038 TaxID=1121424 RepID=A0A1I2UPD5_9FIRM|nr:Rne/Rng family ribonuclease [Desulfotruncus arcticus]SFG76726.1 ribonuclease G [Desulfotomaculum arcticum] [Desulfotruncus arcticus DSM 17038]
MFKEILINVGEEETRVAVLENKVLMEMFIERSPNQRLVGNIFKGRVENVLPGMQAAFVDIGLEKNAFLYVEDAIPSRNVDSGQSQSDSTLGTNICDILKQGQELIVQIVKEPIGTKGARVTTHITLPGRYLVLMPTVDYIGISRRIEDEKERDRLRELAARVKPDGMGVIVRTVAEGVDEDELIFDATMLTGLWRKIINRSNHGPVPNLLHRDLELIQRILRDIFTEDVDRLSVDSRYEYEKIIDLLDILGPRLKVKVFMEERTNLYIENNIDAELEKALKRKVWLKCGGYIVIDQAEALTAIDVNTGKYVGSTNLEDTVLKTNLEAAIEISRQLRLRNLGGIIIVDFIDMTKEEHRRQVLDVLEEEIHKDKTKTNILGITQLGLVEMTRKKVRPSLAEVLQKACPYCDGRGKVLSEETVGISIKQQIQQMAKQTAAETILVEANPLVAARLIGSGGANLRDLEARIGKNLYIRGSAEQHIESVSMRPLYDQDDIQAQTLPVKPGQVLEIRVEEPHANNYNDGIARVNGFILDIEGAGSLVGETIPVEVSKVFRTYAKARLIQA